MTETEKLKNKDSVDESGRSDNLKSILNAGADEAADVKQNNGNVIKDIVQDAAEAASCDIKEQQFGKFKTPQELLKAYNELEREFTKRSQRLSKLESAAGQPSEADWRCAVDKFFDEIPSAKDFAKDIATEIMMNPELKSSANCLDKAFNRVLLNKQKTPEQLMSDGQFLENYVFTNDRVKDAVLENYIKELGRGQPPVTLGDGGYMSASPKSRPKSIEEAGWMFLKSND